MNKKLLISVLVIFSTAFYENAYAHGGGGSDRSYKFDKNNNTAAHEARKKSAEEQKSRESWDNFMKSIKEQETKNNTDDPSAQSNSSSQ